MLKWSYNLLENNNKQFVLFLKKINHIILMIIHHLHECGVKPAYQEDNTALLPHRIPTRKGIALSKRRQKLPRPRGFRAEIFES